jgi:hypothetical protein
VTGISLAYYWHITELADERKKVYVLYQKTLYVTTEYVCT